MARIPDQELERLKEEISVERRRRRAQAPRCRSDRPLPVPRRQDAVAGRESEEEPLPPGRLSDRRHGDRLGDEDAVRVVPAPGRDPAGQSTFSGCAEKKGCNDRKGKKLRI